MHLQDDDANFHADARYRTTRLRSNNIPIDILRVFFFFFCLDDSVLCESLRMITDNGNRTHRDCT